MMYYPNNNSFSAFILAISILMLTSCKDEQLAKSLDGCWKTNYAISYDDQTRSDITMFQQFTYIPNGKKDGGYFSEALYENHSAEDFDDFTVSYKTRSYIDGNWEVVNGDLYLSYNVSNLKVNVYPKEAHIEYDNLMDALDELNYQLYTNSNTKEEVLEIVQKSSYASLFHQYREDDPNAPLANLQVEGDQMCYEDSTGSIVFDKTELTPKDVVNGAAVEDEANQVQSSEEEAADSAEVSSSEEDTSSSDGNYSNAYDAYVSKLNGNEAQYFLFDITGDGAPELWVIDGDCEAFCMLHVYTYQNGLLTLYEGSAAHTTLYKVKGHIVAMNCHQGVNIWTRFSYYGGSVIGKEIFHQETQNYDEIKYPQGEEVTMTSADDTDPIREAVG